MIDPNDNVPRYEYDLKESLVRVSRMSKVREEYGGDHLVAKKDTNGAMVREYGERAAGLVWVLWTYPFTGRSAFDRADGHSARSTGSS